MVTIFSPTLDATGNDQDSFGPHTTKKAQNRQIRPVVNLWLIVYTLSSRQTNNFSSACYYVGQLSKCRQLASGSDVSR